MIGYSGVTLQLMAQHVDPHMDEGEHAHVWSVTAFYPSEPFRDLRSQQAALAEVLGVWQGTNLPPELWSGEALATAVARLLANCIGCRVTRPEGFEAWVWL